MSYLQDQLDLKANKDDLGLLAMLDTIPTFTSSTNGLVPASGGGTNVFLRADGTFVSPSPTAQNQAQALIVATLRI
jgi:hypothetical protein